MPSFNEITPRSLDISHEIGVNGWTDGQTAYPKHNASCHLLLAARSIKSVT